jgi:hypothetical protein
MGDGFLGSMIEMLILAPGLWLACFVGSAIGVLLGGGRKLPPASITEDQQGHCWLHYQAIAPDPRDTLPSKYDPPYK